MNQVQLLANALTKANAWIDAASPVLAKAKQAESVFESLSKEVRDLKQDIG